MIRSSALALLLAPLAAIAHGANAQALSVNVRPGVENDLVISTTFGGVISHDRGATWRAICEEAIGTGTGQRPSWFLSPSGSDFAASFKGLFVARTGGCQWQSLADFETTGCSDLQGRAGTLLAASGKYGVENRILRSTDDGASWAASSEKSTTLFYSTVRFAPSNPQRVYAAAWWFDPFRSVFLRSDDDGRTFTSTDLSSALPAAGAFAVLAVHPSKSEVLFATVSRDSEPRLSWLLRSADSGATFVAVASAPEGFNSASFGTTGSTIYAAAGNQLFASSDEGLTFAVLAHPLKYACVATQGSRVYACGLQELDGWAVGQGAGQDFTPLLKWSGIAGPLACPAGSAVNTLCEPLWPVVQATFPPEPDAGTDGGSTDGGASQPPPAKGCGCATVDGPLVLAALLLLRRLRSAC